MAVVAEGGGLEHAGAAERFHRGGQIIGAGDDFECGAGNSMVAQEIFLPFTVLADFHRTRGRVEWYARGDGGQRGVRNVFKFHGGRSGGPAEIFEGRGIVERQVDHLVGHFHGRRFEAAGPDGGAHVHAACGQGEHAAELAAADDAEHAVFRIDGNG